MFWLTLKGLWKLLGLKEIVGNSFSDGGYSLGGTLRTTSIRTGVSGKFLFVRIVREMIGVNCSIAHLKRLLYMMI